MNFIKVSCLQLVVALFVVFVFVEKPAFAKEDLFLTRGKAFVSHMTKKEFSKAYAMMSPQMKAAMNQSRLKMIWLSLQLKLGTFEKIGTVKKANLGPYVAVLVSTWMKNKSLVWRVVLDQKGVVSGLQFLPGKVRKGSKAKDRVPPYARRNKFTETQVRVGVWKLSGTLSMPKGKGLKPAIVLVHGSGPHDQDQSIGPNKTFRDLAWGLASMGVAVLRYTKRTKSKAFRAFLKKNRKLKVRKEVTVEGETIEDAVAGVNLLMRTKGIDSRRVFVLGHSLGGMMGPAILRSAKKAAGLISLAGASRPLEVLVWNQVNYIFKIDGKVTKEEKKQLGLLKKQLANLKKVFSGKLKSASAKTLPLKASAVYWKSLRRNAPLRFVAAIKKPMFFLQGGRDYQVTIVDFNLWKKTLKGRKDVSFKLYPSLNHLFMSGAGKSLPAEYVKPGFVAVQVLKDVANWAKRAGLPSTSQPSPR